MSTPGTVEGRHSSTEKTHPIRKWLARHPQTIVYVLLAAVVLFALGLNSHNQNADEKARCLGGVDSRNVDRAQAEQIYELFVTFIPKNTSKYNKEQKKQLAEFVANINTFRNSQFAAIKPAASCTKYVHDNPTPQEWVKEHPPKPSTTKLKEQSSDRRARRAQSNEQAISALGQSLRQRQVRGPSPSPSPGDSLLRPRGHLEPAKPRASGGDDHRSGYLVRRVLALVDQAVHEVDANDGGHAQQ